MIKTNILFFLIPKQKVIFVFEDITLDKALEKMKKDRFSAIPILNREGNYVGTLSEGDILWHIKEIEGFNFNKTKDIKVADITRLRDNKPVYVNSNIETLISRASNENFVPVVDEAGLFIGIITRKEIIDYFFEHNFIVL